jgi:hypothetical protein
MIRLLGNVLLWVGIAGGTISLFANLLTPLDMADWAWSIVQAWQDATPGLWSAPVARVVEIPNSLVPALNVGAFLLLTAIGVRVLDGRRIERAVLSIKSHQLVSAGAALVTIGYIVVAAPSQSANSGAAPADGPLIVFLAAASASFSPAIVGPGNLIKRRWLMLAGVGILIALNEATKVAIALTGSAAS